MSDLKEFTLTALRKLNIPFFQSTTNPQLYKIKVSMQHMSHFNYRTEILFTFDKDTLADYENVEYVVEGSYFIDRLVLLVDRESRLLYQCIAVNHQITPVLLEGIANAAVKKEQQIKEYQPLYEFRLKLDCASDERMIRYFSVYFEAEGKLLKESQLPSFDLFTWVDKREEGFVTDRKYTVQEWIEQLYNRAAQEVQELINNEIVNFERETNARLVDELEKLRVVSNNPQQVEGIKEKYRVKVNVEPVGLYLRLFPYIVETYSVTGQGKDDFYPLTHSTKAWEKEANSYTCVSCERETAKVGICDEGRHLACEHCLIGCQKCGKTGCGFHSFSCCEVCRQVLCGDCHFSCSVCKTSLCADHYFTCKRTGKKLCPDHIAACNVCNSHYSTEFVRQCPECGKNLCLDCKTVCAKCGSWVCQDHLYHCEATKKPYCREHIARCSGCGRQYNTDLLKECVECGCKICPECLETCTDCHTSICKNHLHVCAATGKIYCVNHIAGCKECGKSFGHQHLFPCKVCGAGICGDCRLECKICKGSACSEHIKDCGCCGSMACDHDRRTCKVCGQSYGTDCLEKDICLTCRDILAKKTVVLQIDKSLYLKKLGLFNRLGLQRWYANKKYLILTVDGFGASIYVFDGDGNLVYQGRIKRGEFR